MRGIDVKWQISSPCIDGRQFLKLLFNRCPRYLRYRYILAALLFCPVTPFYRDSLLE